RPSAVSLRTKARQAAMRKRPSRRELAGEQRTPVFCRSSLLLLSVQLLAGQNFKCLRSLERILLCVVKCTVGFEILFLNFQVSRHRNGTQAIVVVCRLRCFAQLRHGARPPSFNLGSV